MAESNDSPVSRDQFLYSMSESAGARFAIVNWDRERSKSVTLTTKNLKGLLHSRGRVGSEVEELVTVHSLPPQVRLPFISTCQSTTGAFKFLSLIITYLLHSCIYAQQSAQLAAVLSQSLPGVARSWSVQAESTPCSPDSIIAAPVAKSVEPGIHATFKIAVSV